jgi:hypothetical protein
LVHDFGLCCKPCSHPIEDGLIRVSHDLSKGCICALRPQVAGLAVVSQSFRGAEARACGQSSWVLLQSLRGWLDWLASGRCAFLFLKAST